MCRFINNKCCAYAYFFNVLLECNFPMSPDVRLSVCWLVGRSVGWLSAKYLLISWLFKPLIFCMQDPMNHRTLILIAYSTSISHNVCLEKCLKGITFSSLLYNYPMIQSNETSLLSDCRTFISHNVHPFVLEKA